MDLQKISNQGTVQRPSPTAGVLQAGSLLGDPWLRSLPDGRRRP